MIDGMILTVALATGPDADSRQWAVNRPSRGTHASVIRDASRIPQRWMRWAQCVSARESGGSYSARNPNSSAQGRWQLLDRSWRQNGGIQYIVSKRLKKFGMPAGARKVVRDYLHATEIARWPGPYQDMAAIQIWEDGGAHHWALAGSKCEVYR